MDQYIKENTEMIIQCYCHGVFRQMKVPTQEFHSQYQKGSTQAGKHSLTNDIANASIHRQYTGISIHRSRRTKTNWTEAN